MGPSGGGFSLTIDAIMAARRREGGWTADANGMPVYNRAGSKTAGAAAFRPPDLDALAPGFATDDRLSRAREVLWDEVMALGAAEIQLLLYLSNAWMRSSKPEAGTALNYAQYQTARGLDPHAVAKKSVAQRRQFNARLRRLASLNLQLQVTSRRGTRRHAETHRIQGRMLLAEALIDRVSAASGQAAPPAWEAVLWWRVIPGAAWLASRELGQIGRHSAALITLDPHKQDFLIRLGAYLGYQCAVRGSSGTLAQPLRVRSILAGIHEPLPDDRRMLHKLRERLERALDELGERDILHTWQWRTEGGRGSGFLDDAIVFVYDGQIIAEHAQHHPATRRALGSPDLRMLLPDGSPLLALGTEATVGRARGPGRRTPRHR